MRHQSSVCRCDIADFYFIAVVMFLYTVRESHGVFYFRSRFLCFKRPIKKIQISLKIPCPQSEKGSEKGYGDENKHIHKPARR